jgi:hypothetical protein
MSASSRKRINPAEVEQWLDTIAKKRLALYLRATEPDAAVRAQAFWDMGALLQDALEEVRVMGTELREISEELRAVLPMLRDQSTRLEERSTPHPLQPPRPPADTSAR